MKFTIEHKFDDEAKLTKRINDQILPEGVQRIETHNPLFADKELRIQAMLEESADDLEEDIVQMRTLISETIHTIETLPKTRRKFETISQKIKNRSDDLYRSLDRLAEQDPRYLELQHNAQSINDSIERFNQLAAHTDEMKQEIAKMEDRIRENEKLVQHYRQLAAGIRDITLDAQDEVTGQRPNLN